MEKKYTEEEINAIVEEVSSKLKANGELGFNELEKVSGGQTLTDENGRRILLDGIPYSQAAEKVDEHIRLALAIEEVYGPDVAEIFFDKFGYNFAWGEIRNNGYRCVQRRVKGEFGGW